MPTPAAKNIKTRILQKGVSALTATCAREDQSSTPLNRHRAATEADCVVHCEAATNEDLIPGERLRAQTGPASLLPGGNGHLSAMASPSTDAGLKRHWSGKRCTEDSFPGYFETERKERLKQRYKTIPEEFYSKTGLEVVTPENFGTWFDDARRYWQRDQGSRCVFQLIIAAAGIS